MLSFLSFAVAHEEPSYGNYAAPNYPPSLPTQLPPSPPVQPPTYTEPPTYKHPILVEKPKTLDAYGSEPSEVIPEVPEYATASETESVHSYEDSSYSSSGVLSASILGAVVLGSF
eukprot:NODE_277_length_11973_cov_0.221895.p10 type:complete len:115 gc:universal NODE_277_length_11973_cov_0.221895:6437-6781(+)